MKPGVDYEKPAKAQLPDRMTAGDIVRFNTFFVPTGRFNPRRCIHAPNLNYTLLLGVQARVVSEIEIRAFTHLAGSENDKFLRKMGKSDA